MGPQRFFPERGQSQKPGKQVCKPCPVKAECTDYARRTGSTAGMWAGEMMKRSGNL